MCAMPARYRIPTVPGSSWTATAQTRTPCTNFRVASTHGCPHHYLNRHEKHVRHYDRTMQDVYETTQQKINRASSPRMPRGGNVGMRMGPASKTPRLTSARLWIGPGNSSTLLNPARRLLWRSYQCHQTVPSCHPQSKDPLHRCHLLVPLGQQKPVCTPKDILASFTQPGHTDIQPLLWPHPMSCSASTQPCTIPCCLTAMRANSLFPLCATCVKERNAQTPMGEEQSECNHTDRTTRPDRARGVAPELNKAVELGYEIQYVYEVWHFDETCEGLF